MKNLSRLILFFFLSSCTYDKLEEPAPDNGYPEQIANIITTKCATEGCHNTISRNSVSGLDYSSWDKMFEGGRNGGSVIPYAPAESYMLYAVNTDSLKGPMLTPTMPYLSSPLSNEEYQTLHDWINAGAPDNNGFVRFSDNLSRKKIYICMQGCDKVATIDAESKVVMRYIKVGMNPNFIESPHQVRVSPDGQYWYAVFVAGQYLQKFRTIDDSLVASLDLNQGLGSWNTIIITPDGKKGFVNDPINGKTIIVDLETMTIAQFGVKFYPNPHGGFCTPDGHWVYITNQLGSSLTKVDLTSTTYDDMNITLLSTGESVNLKPHEAMLSPDGTKYFVSCQATNEVRVYQLSNDSLLAKIQVGVLPQEFDVSQTHPYIFVTCTEEPVNANQKGKVYCIDYNTLSIVSSIYTGYQPHGIAVDDDNNLVYVANLNYDPNGPAPHHVSDCGGRNGYLTIIDMNTMQLYQKTQSDGFSYQYKNELLAFPYFVSMRR
jgi:DNA-binding beta-propeller fold protein YncE